jgi:hypothetical protein
MLMGNESIVTTFDQPSSPVEPPVSDFDSAARPAAAFQCRIHRESSSPRNVAAVVQRKAKTSRLAAQQSTLYCCATLVPALVICLPWFGAEMGLSQRAQLVLAFLLQYLLATQGIFNLLIYIRPSYKRLRESQPDWRPVHCLRVCLFSPNPKYW